LYYLARALAGAAAAMADFGGVTILAPVWDAAAPTRLRAGSPLGGGLIATTIFFRSPPPPADRARLDAAVLPLAALVEALAAATASEPPPSPPLLAAAVICRACPPRPRGICALQPRPHPPGKAGQAAAQAYD
jgi:hypothetical protein